MKLHTLAAVAAVGVCLSGCASIVKGSTQSIAITTPPTSGATCMLTNPRGVWQVITPGAVSVKRSKEDMQISCKKDGWNDAFATIPSDFEGWTAGNLVFGGLIGLGVDSATGSINEYPHAYPVPMTQLPPPPPPPPAPAPAQPPAQQTSGANS